ncbi:hypothetical protein J7K25_07670 [bacterium]|nr:hypothetical protein [bacterium]
MKKLGGIVIFIFLWIFFFHQQGSSQEKGLFLYYNFAERTSEKVIDKSGNGNNGFIKGNAQWIKRGKDFCLEFDGRTTYIEIPVKIIDFSNGYTFSMDLYLPGETEEIHKELWPTLFSCQKGGNGVIIYFYKSNHSSFPGAVAVCHKEEKPEYNIAANLKEKVTKGWHNYLFTYDGKNSKIYFDGELLTQKTIHNFYLPLDKPFLIGVRSNLSSEYYLKGRVDNVFIYNRALTQEEIQSLLLKKNRVEGDKMKSFNIGNIRYEVDIEKGNIISAYDIHTDTKLFTTLKFWQIELNSSQGEKKIITPEDTIKFNLSRFSISKENWRLIWEIPVEGKENAIVVVEGYKAQKGSGSYWQINTELKSNKWYIWEVKFPYLDKLGPFSIKKENDYAFWPRTSGRLIKNPYQSFPHMGYWDSLPYPGASWSMQLAAIYGDKSGLYLCSEDSSCRVKQFRYEKKEGNFSFSLTQYPENMGKIKNYHQPYPILIEAFKGDWYTVAEKYRNWALNQPWIRAERTGNWKTGREILSNNALWVINNPSHGISYLIKLRKDIGVSYITHMYSWHTNPFDTYYPEYFPPVPVIPEMIKKMHQNGILFHPYINVRLWDTTLKSFTPEVKENVVKKINGELDINPIGQKKHPTATMCPSSTFWQEKIAGIVEKLVKEYESDGVYLDQFSTGCIPCLNEKHHHPIGGGNYWANGYREMVKKIEEKLKDAKRHYFLTSESFTDAFIGVIDGFLLWVSYGPDFIPFAQSVYGDRAYFWGRWFGKNDFKDVKNFRSKIADMFVQGVQLGWFCPTYLYQQKNYKDLISALSPYVSLWEKANKYLNRGRLIRPPEVLSAKTKSPFEKLSFVWGHHSKNVEVKLPAVMVSLWEFNPNDIALIMANVSEKEQEALIKFPNLDGKWQVEILLYNSKSKTFSWNLSKVNKIEIPAGQPVVIKMKKIR